MLQEIIQFIRRLEEDGIRLSDYVQPPEGLHFLLHYDAEIGEVQVVHETLILKPKKGKVHEVDDVTRAEILPRAIHTNYITSNKAIADKKILSASPYAFRLKRKVLEKQDPKTKSWQKTDWAIHNFGQEAANEGPENGEENVTKKAKKKSGNAVDGYFDAALSKCVVTLSGAQKEIIDAFKQFLYVLPEFLAGNEHYKLLKDEDAIAFYVDSFSVEEYRLANGNYQGTSLFNAKNYTIPVEGGQFIGQSGFFNGDYPKKPYVKHQTASFGISGRIIQEAAQLLNQFNLLQRAKAFATRPLPIFIDEPELNKLAVATLKETGGEGGFRKLMRDLAESRNDDIGNYYLVYTQYNNEKKKEVLKDVDFIPAFRYKVEVTIHALFTQETERGQAAEDAARPLHITNIFELESSLLTPLFRNQLVTYWGEQAPLRYRYFDDLDFDPKYQTPALYDMLIRYRRPWYDYIYKSRQSAVSHEMYHQMVREVILDDLRHHNEGDTGKQLHTRERDIRKKLNRWFSLWNYFQPATHLSNPQPTDMPEKITTLRQRMRELAQGDNEAAAVLQSDEEFAFAAGQVIDYLFSRSEADKPSHAMLEPFVQKTNATQFKDALGRTFQMYMHDIDRFKGKSRFDNLMAAVLGYDYPGNMKDLMPMLLAGYFSKSAIYEKKAVAAGDAE